MINKNSLAELVSTFFYIGRIPFGPGTFGSLAAFPLSYGIIHIVITNKLLIPLEGYSLAELELISMFATLSLCCFLLFLLGIFTSSIYVKYSGKEDPKEVVIDEVVGQMIVIIFGSFAATFTHHSSLSGRISASMIDFIFLFLMPFILFRLFDIFKPWPINYLDKNIKGGLGIMLDDVAAAVFAVVAQYAITFIIIDKF